MLSLRLEVELLDDSLQHHHLVLQAAYSFERVRVVPPATWLDYSG